MDVMGWSPGKNRDVQPDRGSSAGSARPARRLDEFRSAVAQLIAAPTRGAVLDVMVTQGCAGIGGDGAVVVGPGGELLARAGCTDEEATALAARVGEVQATVDPSAAVVVPLRQGRLVVRCPGARPGADELMLLETLGQLADLALQRTELSERERAGRQKLSERERQLAEAQHLAHVGSFELDVASGAFTWSAEYYRQLGYEPHSVEAGHAALRSRIHPDDRPAWQAALDRAIDAGQAAGADYRVLVPGGGTRWLRGRVRALETDPGVRRLVGTTQDITDQKRAESALAHRALHDPLTNLPNRTLCVVRLAEALAVTGAAPSTTAVLFLDLDRFKWVNDSLGHGVGDQVLVAVAKRLRDTMRPGDTVARFGGDEFVALCPNLRHVDEGMEIAHRVLAALAAPEVPDAPDVLVGASIGVAIASGPGPHDPEALLGDADAALYRAKERGRNRVELFDDELRARSRQRFETVSALRRGIQRGELQVHYQPVMDAVNERFVGVEALARWAHPEKGLLWPAKFITLAEESGLIVPLGAEVLAQSCDQMARWQQAGTVPPGLKLSVNLSARQLTAPGLVDRVGRCLSDTGLSPELLCLEITESALMDEAETARTALGALRGIGVTLAIDDFGTGYSSLLYLRRFPIQVLKIDQAFVRGLGCDRSDRAIVAAVIELARAMGASTVAEGVETVDQLLELKQLGCHQAQGYYWSPPHTPHAFEGWLAETAAAGGAGRRAGWTTTVLIADDRRESRTAVRLALELAGGFEIVAEASDGHTAVELAKQHRPELVILDLAMPVLGGLDALPQIVAACPGATVAILSAVDAADAASAARSAGAAGYFEKGLDLDRLAAQLRALVKVPA